MPADWAPPLRFLLAVAVWFLPGWALKVVRPVTDWTVTAMSSAPAATFTRENPMPVAVVEKDPA